MITRVLWRQTMLAAACSLLHVAFTANAQSPASIGGRTIQMTITSGTFPFATSGAYRFLPSAVDGTYAIVPISGDVDPSTGTHAYTKTGANTAALVVMDNDLGALTATCTFSTANAGSYLLTGAAAPGASQFGTFVLYAGPSQATIASATVTITITSGELPFAEFGSYRFQPAASGNTYTSTALSGDVVNSSGTYSYTQTSAYTGLISFDDAVVGPGLSLQLSFDSATTGTVFLRESGSSGYQTGLFSITIFSDPPTITAHPPSQTVNAGAAVTFGVTATGTPPLSFQWRKNGALITGATGATLTIASASAADQGAYDVVVTNAYGSQTSSIAILWVTMHEPPVIESLSLNGELICSGLEPGSVAAVEWAPAVNGPWSSSWAGLDAVQVGDDGIIRVKVPMFYRVRGEAERLVPEGMVLIPAGTFQMGDSLGEGDSDERPVHTVTVSAFYMDKYEVTKALWDDVYAWAIGHGYSFDCAGGGKVANHPIHTVTWYDATKWCNARSEKEGRVPSYCTDAALTAVYKTGRAAPYVRWDWGYRLPTEAEWEYAARGGLSGRRFPWGDTISHSQANYFSWPYSYDISPTRHYHPTYATGGGPYTSPVGSFEANGYGLYDMAGNVWEWCWDWHDGYGSGSQTDPRGPAEGSNRVSRGGGWNYDAPQGRVTHRSDPRPDGGDDGHGFRSVLPPGR